MTKRKILLIQSPEMQGNGTKRHLEAIGLEVIWAGSGLTALMQARKAVIDLILLDVALPDIEGLDLCHRLRVRQDMRTIPIVLLAPRGSMQEDAKREADGPDTYLWKPYLEKDMDNLISSILDAKAAAMEPASRPVLTLVQKKDSVRERRSSTESATMEEPRPSLIAVPQPSKPDLKLVIKTEPILQPESAKSFVLQEDQQKKQEPEASRSPIPLSNTGQSSVTRQDTIAPSPIPPFSGTGETVVDPDTGLFGRPQFEAMFS